MERPPYSVLRAYYPDPYNVPAEERKKSPVGQYLCHTHE